MSGNTQEKIFQNDILAQIQSHGWLTGESNHYNKELALYPDDVIAFIKTTQPDQWEKLAKSYPTDSATAEALLKSLERDLKAKGTLWVLRNLVKDRGAKFSFCAFKPDHELNPEATQRYQQNILRVVPELVYSPNGYDGRIDLTLFVNGIPVATCELKSEFKQALNNAKIQYMKDRQPKDPVTKKAEPLLTFKRGALVHFAVSQYNVAMTTCLAGNKTFFLPFDRGTAEGGAGNDYLDAGFGSDTYVFGSNFGHDTILNYDYSSNRKDVIKFIDGISKDQLTFSRNQQFDLIIKLGYENSITVRNFFINDAQGNYQIDEIIFDNGTVLKTEDIKKLALLGTSNDDEYGPIAQVAPLMATMVMINFMVI